MKNMLLIDDLQMTKAALECAYNGFDNATDPDLIDCYIFELNSLLKRYRYLMKLSGFKSGSFENIDSIQLLFENEIREDEAKQDSLVFCPAP